MLAKGAWTCTGYISLVPSSSTFGTHCNQRKNHDMCIIQGAKYILFYYYEYVLT